MIPYSTMGLVQKDGPARASFSFPIARFFRLYPVYWLSVILTAVLLHPPIALLLTNLSMFQRLIGRTDLLGPYWTLEVELIFYLLIESLLLTRRLSRYALYPVLSIVFALSAVLMGFVRFHFGLRTPMAPPAGLAVMFFGTCWFLHTRHAFLSRARIITLGLAVYALLGVSFTFGYSHDWGFNEQPKPFCLTYLAAALVFFAFQATSFRSTVLGFLGRISYPVYLFHVPILTLGSRLFPTLPFWLASSVEVLVLLLLATLLHYTVENPSIRLGRSLLRRFSPSEPHLQLKTSP